MPLCTLILTVLHLTVKSVSQYSLIYKIWNLAMFISLVQYLIKMFTCVVNFSANLCLQKKHLYVSSHKVGFYTHCREIGISSVRLIRIILAASFWWGIHTQSLSVGEVIIQIRFISGFYSSTHNGVHSFFRWRWKMFWEWI